MIASWRLIAGLVGTIAVATAIIALAVTGRHWRGERDDLLAAASAASHAVDARGAPRDLSTGEAVKTIRAMGGLIDQARRATSEAKAADAGVVVHVAAQDAATTQEVSTDVLDQLARTRADLATAHALAGQRLRELTAARATLGGGGGEAVPYDPEPACRAYAGTDCDGLLAKLGAAQEQAQQLLGWQRFYPTMKATHDAAAGDQLPAKAGQSETANRGGDDVTGSAGRAP